MQKYKLSLLVIIFTLFCSCKKETPIEIRTLCLRDDIGNYIIKWECFPKIEGMLKIYVSNNPEGFDYTHPVGYVDINDGVTTYITKENITRKYFRLVFDNKFERVVSSRNVSFERIHNFRDLGGYQNRKARESFWGKFYRSGDLSRISSWDSIRLECLQLKTIIDFRGDIERKKNPNLISNNNVNIYNIPIKSDNQKSIELIKQGKMKSGDVNLFLQDRYIFLMDKNKKAYSDALNILTDPTIYPVLVCGAFGKDRIGFLVYLVLSILDIPDDTIEKDFLLSNEFIKKTELAYIVYNLDTDAQEALTDLLSVNSNLYHFIESQINKKYGSVSNYIVKELNFSKQKQQKLKNILLKPSAL